MKICAACKNRVPEHRLMLLIGENKEFCDECWLELENLILLSRNETVKIFIKYKTAGAK